MGAPDLLKGTLRAAGRVPVVRRPLVWALRISLRASPAGRIRDLLLGPVTSYLLPKAYRSPVTQPDGTRLNGGPLDIVTRMILFFGDSQAGCWEPSTARIAAAVVERGGDVIVGGAHVGFFAIALARVARRSGGRVFAFEPAPVMFEELRQNMTLNEVPNLIVEVQALSESTGEGMLYLQGVRSSLQRPTKGPVDVRERVRLVTIDDYVSQRGITKVSLLFLDIEGAELSALHGAKRLLTRPDAPDVIFEVIATSTEAGAAVEAYLRPFGYSVFYIDDDYELMLRHATPPLRVRPLSAAPTGHRYFNALATRAPERLTVMGVRLEGTASAA